MQKVSFSKISPAYYILLVGLAVVIIAVAGAMSSKTPTSNGFVREATIGNQFEISSSRLALANSQNDDVKAFAQQMIDDHSLAADQLKAVLSNSDATIPVPNPSLDGKHQKILDKLDVLKNADFDREYIHAQVRAHDEAVALFRNYAEHGDNAALRKLALTTLPMLQDHQRRIHQLADQQS